MFQSTHPRGVRRKLYKGVDVPCNVSIHAPAWGATIPFATFSLYKSRFNPRTRVGCDSAAASKAVAYSAFQSTHPRGVRPEAPSLAGAGLKFQSTHPRGVRHGFIKILLSEFSKFQSTHPRGVRPRSFPSGAINMVRFNPRTRVGCDAHRQPEYWWFGVFQSTHPRGVRRK